MVMTIGKTGDEEINLTAYWRVGSDDDLMKRILQSLANANFLQNGGSSVV